MKNSKSPIIKLITLLVLFLGGTGLLFAQTGSAESAAKSGLSAYIAANPLEFYLFIATIALLVLLLVVLFLFLTTLLTYFKSLNANQEATEAKKAALTGWAGLLTGNTAVLTGEYTEQAVEDHDYDGIQELDNSLPPWWKMLFWATIVFGVVYLLNYHVFKVAPLQEEEYEIAMAKAEEMYASVDLDYEAPETDESLLASAKEVFLSNCAACHGREGEGGIGPNLTDEYWLHGGSVNDVYSSIKYGIPDKGMKAWEKEFTNKDVYNIASYIKSIKGTNPPNAKEPQGELYDENVASK